jgi:hypothetical protein
VKSHVENISREKAVRELFGTDIPTDLVLRGVASPAETTTPGWAQQLAITAIEDSVIAITSLSAAAALIARAGLKVNMTGIQTVKIPGWTIDTTDAGVWLAENAPIPVRQQRYTTGVTMAPRKLMVIITYTREMIESSNLEAISRDAISREVALALDAALFSANADDGAHPGGILNGITALTPTAGGGTTAMTGDLGKLTTDLVSKGAGRDPVLIMNPTQAMTLSLFTGPNFKTPILVSSQVAAGTVIMVEASSFVAGFGAVPQFETSKVVLLHQDTTPNADPMAGTPTKSMFQVDSTALRMLLRAAWVMRAPHVSWMSGVTW